MYDEIPKKSTKRNRMNGGYFFWRDVLFYKIHMCEHAYYLIWVEMIVIFKQTSPSASLLFSGDFKRKRVKKIFTKKFLSCKSIMYSVIWCNCLYFVLVQRYFIHMLNKVIHDPMDNPYYYDMIFYYCMHHMCVNLFSMEWNEQSFCGSLHFPLFSAYNMRPRPLCCYFLLSCVD